MLAGNRNDKRLMSQINVTPLVDVMLVLLIIFMVTAPMMQAGIDVELPKVEASAIKAADEPVIVTIDRWKRVFVGERAVRTTDLKDTLERVRKERRDVTVLLKADENVPYGTVASAMSEIRKAGIEKVGMVTEPVKEGR